MVGIWWGPKILLHNFPHVSSLMPHRIYIIFYLHVSSIYHSAIFPLFALFRNFMVTGGLHFFTRLFSQFAFLFVKRMSNRPVRTAVANNNAVKKLKHNNRALTKTVFLFTLFSFFTFHLLKNPLFRFLMMYAQIYAALD